MAKKEQSTVAKKAKKKISRPGVHSKTKTSKLKGSKLYTKKYKSQGK
jgi:hypothetical protein